MTREQNREEEKNPAILQQILIFWQREVFFLFEGKEHRVLHVSLVELVMGERKASNCLHPLNCRMCHLQTMEHSDLCIGPLVPAQILFDDVVLIWYGKICVCML